MNKYKNVVLIHNRMQFSHNRKRNPVIWGNMNGPGDHFLNEVSQAQKEKCGMFSPIHES
jgi:hypothetical protein